MTSNGFQLFPTLDEATEAALVASIQRFGVLVPVVVSGGPWQKGHFLDGHHRRAIARRLERDCPLRYVPCHSEEEAREIARTLNLDRRHLDAEQRREIVAHLRQEGHSLRAIAGAVGVSKSQVANDLGEVSTTGQVSEVLGQDGKRYPARRPAREVEPGDVVTDGLEEHELLDVEVEDDETVVLRGEDGLALVVPPDHEVDVVAHWCPACRYPMKVIAEACPQCGEVEDRARSISKPDLGGGVSHPARFSAAVLDMLTELVAPGWRVLDPFAGAGGIHYLQEHGVDTVGVEIEPEWAALSADTIVGDALALPFADHSFDAIVTSPTYGNRLADSYEGAADPELRRSYRFDLGRPLSEANSGSMHWGPDYRAFHQRAWKEALRVLRPGGSFVLNIKDHIRDGQRQRVSAWHAQTLMGMGLTFVDVVPVPTPMLRQGANAGSRLTELVWVFKEGSR